MLNINHNKDVPQKVRRQSSGVPPGSLTAAPTNAQSNKFMDLGHKTSSSLVPSSMPTTTRTSIAGELNPLTENKCNYGKYVSIISIIHILYIILYILYLYINYYTV